MESYDISNIQGKMPVGSMVVFEAGKPKTADYRRFRIKMVTGADDYAMLAEVLKRRFKRSQTGGTGVPACVPEGNEAGDWAKIPDLVLIDGGKGQLSAGVAAMKSAGAEAVPAAGLAKEREEIFVPGRSNPIVLPESSPARQMLQRLRDEAHRFAITYHRNIRKKESFASVLDTVPGIGKKRKLALLRKFGSVKAIREADTTDLAAAAGMNSAAAQKLKEYLV
jgi:excinuclease ABC subunit C